MARKSTKTTENLREPIMNAIDTPVNLEWGATAQKLNTSIPDLQERVSAKLNDSTVFAWDNLPVEHEPVVEAIARDLQSEASVRPLNAQQTPQVPAEVSPPPPPAVAEIPLLEEEPEPPSKQKRKSTGMTKSRKSGVQKLTDDTVMLEEGIHETELNLAAQEGIQDGAQIETAYLVAKRVTRNNVRKEAAKHEVARVVQKTARQKDFNPVALLEKHGLKPASEDLEELNQLVTPAVEMVGNATGEILDNSWVNGLTIDCSNLNDLMSDAWSE